MEPPALGPKGTERPTASQGSETQCFCDCGLRQVSVTKPKEGMQRGARDPQHGGPRGSVPGRHFATSPPEDVAEALAVWRDGLINLTGTNRALNFEHTKLASVPIEAPDLAFVVTWPASGPDVALSGAPGIHGCRFPRRRPPA